MKRSVKKKLIIVALMASFLVFGVVCVGLDAGHADVHNAQSGLKCYLVTLVDTSGVYPLMSIAFFMASLLLLAKASAASSSELEDRRRSTLLHPIPLKVLPLQRRLAHLQTLLH